MGDGGGEEEKEEGQLGEGCKRKKKLKVSVHKLETEYSRNTEGLVGAGGVRARLAFFE